MKRFLAILFLFCSVTVLAQQNPSRAFVYKTVEGKNLELDIWMPTEKVRAGVTRPAVILFHGGGWTGGNRSAMERQCAYFADRGIVAVSASYRLISKGSSNYEAEFRKCIYDAKSAVRWVRLRAAEFGIDTSRLILGGGSAGGYLAVMSALDDSINEPNEDISVSTKAKALVLFNPAFPKRPEVPSPFGMINSKAPEVISFFGTEDSVWLPEGAVFTDMISRAGIRNELWMAPGEKHGFFNQEAYTYGTLKLADEFLSSAGLLKKIEISGKHPNLIRRTN